MLKNTCPRCHAETAHIGVASQGCTNPACGWIGRLENDPIAAMMEALGLTDLTPPGPMADGSPYPADKVGSPVPPGAAMMDDMGEWMKNFAERLGKATGLPVQIVDLTNGKKAGGDVFVPSDAADYWAARSALMREQEKLRWALGENDRNARLQALRDEEQRLRKQVEKKMARDQDKAAHESRASGSVPAPAPEQPKQYWFAVTAAGKVTGLGKHATGSDAKEYAYSLGIEVRHIYDLHNLARLGESVARVLRQHIGEE